MAEHFPALGEAIGGDEAHLVRRHRPVFDFDSDGCYPSAAISRDGVPNPGLNHTGSFGGGCRLDNFLQSSNTYHRWARRSVGQNVYSVHLFDLYFLKDQAAEGAWDPFGHRHDIESVIIFFKNGAPTHVGRSGHGGWTMASWANVPKENNRPKIVYHKDGVRTHAFRFAKNSESAENDYNQWVTPPIVSWFHMVGDSAKNVDLREVLNDPGQFGDAHMGIRDSRFLLLVDRAMGADSSIRAAGYPNFNFTDAFSTKFSAAEWADHEVPLYITHLYHAFFGRGPSSRELSSHTAAIVAGTKDFSSLMREIIDYIWASRSDTQKVEALYRSILFREPDSGGLRYYLDRHNSGESWAYLAQRMINSYEFSKQHIDIRHFTKDMVQVQQSLAAAGQ